MYSTLYWLTRLDAIHGLFVIIAAAAFISAVMVMGYYAMSFETDEDDLPKYLKATKKLGIVCLVFALISVFIPTKNDAILIVAGGKTYEYIQADTSLQKLPFKTTEYLKTVLEQEIKEAKQELSK